MVVAFFISIGLILVDVVIVVVVIVVVIVIVIVVIVVVVVDGFGLRGVEVDFVFNSFVLFHSEVVHDSCFGGFCGHQNFSEQF